MNKKGIMIYLFLTPAVVLCLIYFIAPLLLTLYTGFTEWDGINMPVFNGFDNYIRLFQERTFWISLINTALWISAALLIQLPLAALVAIILSKKIKGWKIFRFILFFPAALSVVTLGSMWREGMYGYSFGAINIVLKTLGLGNLQTDWLGNFDMAFIALLGTFVFYGGLYMIIIMAKISTIPKELYEAAEIDGASSLRKDIHITLPNIASVYGTCIVLAVVSALKCFDLVYIVTGGGPATQTYNLPFYMYQQINGLQQAGSANSVGIILMITGIIVMLLINRLFKRFEIEV